MIYGYDEEEGLIYLSDFFDSWVDEAHNLIESDARHINFISRTHSRFNLLYEKSRRLFRKPPGYEMSQSDLVMAVFRYHIGG